MARHGSYSTERIDGRKFDWIRKQLGLFKAELARQHGISRQSLLLVHPGRSDATCCFDNRRYEYRDRIAWGVRRVSEPEEGMTRIPKGRQGIRCAKNFFIENVT